MIKSFQLTSCFPEGEKETDWQHFLDLHVRELWRDTLASWSSTTYVYCYFTTPLLKDTPLPWIYKNSKYDSYGIFTAVLVKEKMLWRRREWRGGTWLPTSLLLKWLAVSGVCSLNGPLVCVIREWDTSV